jgi:hypothetical protein
MPEPVFEHNIPYMPTRLPGSPTVSIAYKSVFFLAMAKPAGYGLIRVARATSVKTTDAAKNNKSP